MDSVLRKLSIFDPVICVNMESKKLFLVASQVENFLLQYGGADLVSGNRLACNQLHS